MINRGKTAMSRNRLSRPVARAIADGVLSVNRSFFDYGCGRGGDVMRLYAMGYVANGWDPNHSPTSPLIHSSVVNLGYVLNVIEDISERAAVLRAAWSLTAGVLIVSARLVDEAASVKGAPYGDGIVTTAGTFQHFYTMPELKDFISATLGAEARIEAAAPGIYYVRRPPTPQTLKAITRHWR